MCPELAHSRLTKQEREQSRAMWALQRESRPRDGAGSHPWAPADNWQGCQRTTRQQRSPETNGKRKANPSEIRSFKSNNMENYGHARELCTCRALPAALRGCFQTQRQDKAAHEACCFTTCFQTGCKLREDTRPTRTLRIFEQGTESNFCPPVGAPLLSHRVTCFTSH